MAKMFAFVFSRLTMLFCCRWKNKKRRISLKTPANANNSITTIENKIPLEKSISKSSLKRIKEETSKELYFSKKI